jgi:phospholipase/carboxylesterase
MDDLSFKHIWNPGTKSRTLLLLHGTGGDENDLIPVGKTLDPDANLLSVRGRVDENGANRFFRGFGEGVFDQENMRQVTAALAEFIGAASLRYGFDTKNLFAVGFSNGANIGASLLMRHPEVLAGGVLIRAMVPFEPSSPVDLAGVRLLLSSGAYDPMVPRAAAERLAAIFVQGGADVEHVWAPVGHNLTREELDHARDWLAR